MRVALEIGHSTRDGGAVRVTDGVQEYEWNKDLAVSVLRRALSGQLDVLKFHGSRSSMPLCG